MFDIGFLELILVGIIGLLVLGPERLPVAARTLGKWLGRARRMASQFTKEIDKQIEIDELRAELKKQGESLDINQDVNNIRSTVSEALKEAEEFEPLPRNEPNQAFTAPENISSENSAPVNHNPVDRNPETIPEKTQVQNSND